MKIKKQLAQDIVNSIKEILHYEINFMDTEGKVIGSTDSNRIGTFHEGARKVYQSKKDLFILPTDTMEGSFEGYNTSVYFNEEIIGIVGVTGPIREVTQLANIIKKLTELMIKEAYYINIDYSNQFHQRSILEFITSEKENISQTDLPILNYDISINRRSVYTEFSLSQIKNIDLYHIIQNYFPDDENLIVVDETKAIFYLTEVDKEFLEKRLEKLNNHLVTNFNVKFFFGVGEECNNLKSSRESHQQAKYAYYSHNNHRNVTTKFFDDMTLELLFIDWDEPKAKYFCNKIIGNIEESEAENYDHLLQIYEKTNGSITKCAEKLYIHKNTVQYRLNKLAELTGYNPRDLSDFVLLKIAFLANKTV